MLSRLALATLLGLPLLGCGDDDSKDNAQPTAVAWSADSRTSFLTGCTPGAKGALPGTTDAAATTQCTCTVDALQAKYTEADYKANAAAYGETAKVDGTIDTCRAKAGIVGVQGAPRSAAYRLWSTSFGDQWRDTCRHGIELAYPGRTPAAITLCVCIYQAMQDRFTEEWVAAHRKEATDSLTADGTSPKCATDAGLPASICGEGRCD